MSTISLKNVSNFEESVNSRNIIFFGTTALSDCLKRWYLTHSSLKTPDKV
jgi:hypothetical protein